MTVAGILLLPGGWQLAAWKTINDLLGVVSLAAFAYLAWVLVFIWGGSVGHSQRQVDIDVRFDERIASRIRESATGFVWLFRTQSRLCHFW